MGSGKNQITKKIFYWAYFDDLEVQTMELDKYVFIEMLNYSSS